jgi:hypothetical protein
MILLRILMMAAIGLLLAPGCASALNIGLAPAPAIDAGEMIPGESKLMDFFIMSDNDDDMLVSINTKDAPRSFFNPKKGRFRYGWSAEESSEEGISGWATLMDDSVIVPPDQELRYLKGGGAAYANKKLSVIISVPDDAEPGYHAGFISPYPRMSSQAGGTGLGIITVVEMAYVVNVLGNALRDAEIVGVNLRRDAPERGTVQILVKNKGTVTVSAVADSVRVYDSSNSTILETRSNEFKIGPGDIGTIEVALDTRGLEGEYNVHSHVEWLTGEGDIDGVIDIGEYVPPPPGVTGEVVSPVPAVAFPLWLVPVILVALAGLVYWRIR